MYSLALLARPSLDFLSFRKYKEEALMVGFLIARVARL